MLYYMKYLKFYLYVNSNIFTKEFMKLNKKIRIRYPIIF